MLNKIKNIQPKLISVGLFRSGRTHTYHRDLKAYENYFGVIHFEPLISYGRMCSLIIFAKSLVEMSQIGPK